MTVFHDLPERIRVIALWSRWAAVVAAGLKTIETRRWRWTFPPGWLAICATKCEDGKLLGRVEPFPECPPVTPQALCALVWVAGCRSLVPEDKPKALIYAPGLWAWDLERIHRLRPVPMSRAPQKFSSIDRASVLAALEE